MHLKEFRVQNYKKISDTGWVRCRDLTVFVGKNEAGKSAIFRGLSKVNPSDGEPYDGLKEFPRRRYTDEFDKQDWPAGSCRFELDKAEKTALAGMSQLLDKVESVVVTRHYSNKLTVDFDPPPTDKVPSGDQFAEVVTEAVKKLQELTAPDGKGDQLGAVKQALGDQLQTISKQLAEQESLTEEQVNQAITAISNHANEDWLKKRLDPLKKRLTALAEVAERHEEIGVARQWVEARVPQFIYFDRYDVLQTAVHIPTFVNQLKDTPNVPGVRTTHCLFKHVGLDVHQLEQLGQYESGGDESEEIRREIDQRAILASSASNAITAKFESWWEQRKHKLRYQLDGDYFRIWVSDDLDPSEIELDQRSLGMQYFFSFYIVFLVESEGAHAGSILLLDEPGLHLHGTAQAKVVEFLNKLSTGNQTLYTTHAPFMIDVDHLERARAVFEGADGTTQVSEDVWPRDRDSLFPLQAALGYNLAQGLFVSKRQIIIEGISDLWLLKALDLALGKAGKTQLRDDLVLVPSAGVTKLLPLASMLLGHDVEVAALLDGDEPARREGKKLVDKLLAGEDRKCLFIGDFVDNDEAEIEDIFPEAEYLTAVKAAYPGVTLTFNAQEKAMPRVADRVKANFERKGVGKFEKALAAAELRDRIFAAPDKVDTTTLDAVDQIFQKLNQLFSVSGAANSAAT